MSVRTLIIASHLALLPSLGGAQNRAQTRDGFWFNGGAGFGTAGCVGCNGRQSAPTFTLSIGGTISRTVLLGVSFDSWTKSEGGSLTVSTLLARLRFYASETSGFFLTAGAGLGTKAAEATDIGSRTETGMAALIGLGYDLRVGPNVSLTPFLNGFATGTLDPNYNVGQLGLSVTVH